MSASAFSLSVLVPASGFEAMSGQTVLGGAERDMHHFCPSCLTWVFTRPEGLEWLVNVRSTMLDRYYDLEPFIETYVSEKLDWAQTGAQHSFAKTPEVHEYDGLMSEFAQYFAVRNLQATAE